MEESAFYIGQPVIVRGQSVSMTVREILPTGYIICQWFTEKGDLKQAPFPEAMLEEIPPMPQNPTP